MADKTIGQLSGITLPLSGSELFVAEQNGQAKNMSAQDFNDWLANIYQAGGFISSITGPVSTGTNPRIDTYTINFSGDLDPVNFTVTNGLKGDTGDQTYVHIRWAAGSNQGANPPLDTDSVYTVPNDWIGIYSTTVATAPAKAGPNTYVWYKYKGDKGDTGTSITGVELLSSEDNVDTYRISFSDNNHFDFDVTNGTSIDSVVVNRTVGTETFYNIVLTDGSVIEDAFSVSNGVGSVNTINGHGVDQGTSNITLVPGDIGAPVIPLHLVATLTALPQTLANANITGDMRVVECTFGTPSAITSNVSWTTSAGEIVLSGTMSGSTTVDLILIQTTT